MKTKWEQESLSLSLCVYWEKGKMKLNPFHMSNINTIQNSKKLAFWVIQIIKQKWFRKIALDDDEIVKWFSSH